MLSISVNTRNWKSISEYIHERECGSLRCEKVEQKTQSSCDTFVQAERSVGLSGISSELGTLREVGEHIGSMDVLLVVGQTVQQKKHVRIPSDSVTYACESLIDKYLHSTLETTFAAVFYLGLSSAVLCAIPALRIVYTSRGTFDPSNTDKLWPSNIRHLTKIRIRRKEI